MKAKALKKGLAGRQLRGLKPVTAMMVSTRNVLGPLGTGSMERQR